MKTKSPLFLVLSAALAAPACGSNGSDTAATCNGTELKAEEAHNYTVSSSITLPPIKIAQRQNLTFDWSAVTTGRMRPLSPCKVNWQHLSLTLTRRPSGPSDWPVVASAHARWRCDLIGGSDHLGRRMMTACNL